jgi:hypothetical protein
MKDFLPDGTDSDTKGACGVPNDIPIGPGPQALNGYVGKFLLVHSCAAVPAVASKFELDGNTRQQIVPDKNPINSYIIRSISLSI